MPTWLKVFLIIAGLVVVLVLVSVVAGVYFLKKYGPELVEAGKQAVTEAQEYGRRTDNEGCLNEAVARHSRSEGFADMIKVNLFLRICLESSRPTPGFCNDVPRQTEFIKSAQWQLQQCGHYNLKTEKQCGQLFQQVQQFCDPNRQRPPGIGHPNFNADDEQPPPPPPAPAPRRAVNAR